MRWGRCSLTTDWVMLLANYCLDDPVLAELSWKQPIQWTDRTAAMDVDIYLSPPKKKEKKYPQHLRSWDIVWEKKTFCRFFFSLSMNKNVSFTFGLALTCSCWLSWSCTSSLLSSATHGPGLADLDFPQTGMPALQPRPEAAEASWFWGPWHQLFRLLDTLSIMLLFDLFGPE